MVIGAVSLIPASAADRELFMERTARMSLAIGATICGALAVASWIVAVHAFRATPTMQDIAVQTANRGLSVQDKAGFLFAPPLFQTFFFWMLFQPAVWWKRHVRKLAEKTAPKDMWTMKWQGITYANFCKFVSAGLCLLSSAFLYWCVERAEYVMSKI